MSTSFQNIVIVGKPDEPRVTEPTEQLRAHLTEAGVNLLAREEVASADLVIAIGGDGTMLYASRLARESGTPILGINRGRLGFLADVTPEEMLTSVDHVLQGNYSTDSRLLLEARMLGSNGNQEVAYALNDIVLQRRETGRMVDFETRIAGQYVNTHSGDGLVIATPTGSTAYALSCGGPIMSLLQRDDTRAEITVDGYSMSDILPGDKLQVSAANNRVTLVHPPGYDFYGVLRSKLFWGRDSRTRDA